MTAILRTLVLFLSSPDRVAIERRIGKRRVSLGRDAAMPTREKMKLRIKIAKFKSRGFLIEKTMVERR